MSVYINRTLNMKHIKYIGFDMDHTLVRYHTKAFEKLAYDVTVEKLIAAGYPKVLKDLVFNFDLVVRGLVIDCQQGNLLKLNRHASIRSSTHGTKPIDYKAQHDFYRGELIDLSDPNYIPVDTSFAISAACLFAQLVDLKDSELQDQLPSYAEMMPAILKAVDMAHRDGSLKDVVRENLETYIQPDPELPPLLERYRRHGKKLFVLTNSDYHYTRLLLDYAIKPYLQDTKCWSELFEFVITLAMKPKYFFDHQVLLKVDPETGTMSNFDAPIVPGIYQGGCADHFTKSLGLRGDDILYVGDHIYGDILRLKKDCAWRTALVIEELEQEVKGLVAGRPISQKIEELMAVKRQLEIDLRPLEDELIERKNKDVEQDIEQILFIIGNLNKKISLLIKEYQTFFNPYWGETMRIGNEKSYLAGQTDRYACIYAANLKNLLSQSPRSYMRNTKRLMPHEG